VSFVRLGSRDRFEIERRYRRDQSVWEAKGECAEVRYMLNDWKVSLGSRS